MPADGQTLFVPKPRATSIGERATTGLPPDLLNRVAARLQVLAWLYAFTFFMAGFFPMLVTADGRRMLISLPLHWLPGTLSIAVAVAVALSVRFGKLPPGAVTLLGLAFEVVASYGIAAAEFLQPTGLTLSQNWIGMSWVGVWMLLFNVVVPTFPRYAVLAALASVTSVPVLVLLSISVFPPNLQPNSFQFFFA